MMDVPGYEVLAKVLQLAYDQAARGKGKERHAQDKPFQAQPMQTISDLIGSHDGLAYQAIKKIQESQRLGHDAAVRELLGAINYIAGVIIFREARMPVVVGFDSVVGPDKTSGGGRGPVHAIERPECVETWVCKACSPKLGSLARIPIGESCPRCHATK